MKDFLQKLRQVNLKSCACGTLQHATLRGMHTVCRLTRVALN